MALFDEKDRFVQTVTIASHRKHKNFDIIKFKDMYHINAIEKFKGYSLKVAEEDLNDLDEGEFYYHEIIGLMFEGDDQPDWNHQGNPATRCQRCLGGQRKGKRDFLLPYIPPVVLNIDIPNNRVDVEILEGLDDED